MNNPYGHYRRHNTPAAEHMAALWKETAREHVARSSSARQHARDCHDSMDAAVRRANKAEFDAATYRADRDAAEEERDEAARERDLMRAILVHANKAIARVRRDAAREALDGLAEHIDWTASQFLGVRVGSQKAQDVRNYRDTHYPEETP